MQGSVWGPLCCTATMDKIGKKAYQTGSPLYSYKSLVSVPPLGMVDDEISMSRCSVDATKTNAFMNNFAEMKKLEFGAKKCHKIHVGSKNDLCFDMRVHDGYGDKVESEKYVGDIISQDGSNNLKVKERYDAGFGTINEIEYILDELPLGQFRIVTGLKLRESLFISRLLFNSESWYNMKESEIERLNPIDEILMRKILKTPANTCKEALFLETGCLPVKYIIMKRRLMYLQQIVKRIQLFSC